MPDGATPVGLPVMACRPTGLAISLFIPIFIAMLAPFPYGVNNFLRCR